MALWLPMVMLCGPIWFSISNLTFWAVMLGYLLQQEPSSGGTRKKSVGAKLLYTSYTRCSP